MTADVATYDRVRARSGARSREISPAVRAAVELLDQRFRVPGTRIRFGLDAVLGLVPGVGDLMGMLLGYGLVFEAFRLRARWRVIARMAWNLWVNAVIGAVPVIGDVFDFLSHPHRTNLALLEQELAR
jgi:hypothetical protein